jgi:hypothetical protein
MLRQPVLENFHERLLFFYGQVGGGIQNLRELCHGRNLASGPILGNYVLPHTDSRERRIEPWRVATKGSEANQIVPFKGRIGRRAKRAGVFLLAIAVAGYALCGVIPFGVPYRPQSSPKHVLNPLYAPCKPPVSNTLSTGFALALSSNSPPVSGSDPPGSRFEVRRSMFNVRLSSLQPYRWLPGGCLGNTASNTARPGCNGAAVPADQRTVETLGQY